jgi:ribonuclease P protein component
VPKGVRACLSDAFLAVAPLGYPRSLRLLTAAEFQQVFKRCDYKASDRLMTVLAIHNGLDYPRLGTAVSIKAAGNAVRRNRIKRLIRESFRQHQLSLAGLDLVVTVRHGLSALSNPQILAILDTHWRTIAAHAQTATHTD